MWNRFGAVAEVLSSELFRRIMNSDCIKINELNAAVAALIEAGIDFSLTFVSGTSGTRPAAVMTIAVSPTTDISVEFLFECY
jgi:hypothetical protein